MVNHSETDTVLKTLLEFQGSNTMLGRMREKYDPFRILISTILSARAKDEVTEIISEELFKRYPDAESLASANRKDVVKIIRRIGFYNVKSRNIIRTAKLIVGKFNGSVPKAFEELIELPGVGRKVANCVLVYAFNIPALPIDTHCHRVPNRLGWIKTNTPEETEEKLVKLIPKKHWLTFNDTIVTHGKTVCLPRNPRCSHCPINNYCQYYRKKCKHLPLDTSPQLI